MSVGLIYSAVKACDYAFGISVDVDSGGRERGSDGDA